MFYLAEFDKGNSIGTIRWDIYAESVEGIRKLTDSWSRTNPDKEYDYVDFDFENGESIFSLT
jgi:hypothetical protein